MRRKKTRRLPRSVRVCRTVWRAEGYSEVEVTDSTNSDDHEEVTLYKMQQVSPTISMKALRMCKLYI